MTVRVFVTLLMLAQAIACPFLHCGECQGACADSCVETHHQDDGCEAESGTSAGSLTHTGSTVPGNSPSRPDCPDHNGSVGCLCDGAIRVSAVRCPDLIAGGLFLGVPDSIHSRVGPLLSGNPLNLTRTSAVHFPPLITGRRVCAMSQTLLL